MSFIAPNYSRVTAFAQEHGILEKNCETFFEHYTKKNWCDSNGKQLTSWEGVLVNWDKRNRAKTNRDKKNKASNAKSLVNDMQDEIESLRNENERLKSAYSRSLAKHNVTQRSESYKALFPDEPIIVVEHKHGATEIRLMEWPDETTWWEVKRRALATIGKKPKNVPDSKWIHDILNARHSPIRYARYCFEFTDIPSNTATHFTRHVHIQPYVSTLRNDLQDVLDGDNAPRCTPVGMILDVNAEALMVLANKRLCVKASQVTREIMKGMCELAEMVTPEMKGLLVPMCEYHGNVCHEMNGCGKCRKG